MNQDEYILHLMYAPKSMIRFYGGSGWNFKDFILYTLSLTPFWCCSRLQWRTQSWLPTELWTMMTIMKKTSSQRHFKPRSVLSKTPATAVAGRRRRRPRWSDSSLTRRTLSWETMTGHILTTIVQLAVEVHIIENDVTRASARLSLALPGISGLFSLSCTRYWYQHSCLRKFL